MLRLDGKYIDSELGQLSGALNLIDSKLTEFLKEMDQGFSETLAEVVDYYIGFGFTAIQKYFGDVSTWVQPAVEELIKFGPSAKSGLPVMQVIHAGANWWKHEADCWRGIGLNSKTHGPVAATVPKLNTFLEYTMINVLYELAPGGELKLSLLIPLIEEWRDDVMSKCPRLIVR